MKGQVAGWDGFFENLLEPRRSLLQLLSVFQTWPSVWVWLVLSHIGARPYLSAVPLPVGTTGAPRLYIGGLPLPWQMRQVCDAAFSICPLQLLAGFNRSRGDMYTAYVRCAALFLIAFRF